VLEEIEVLLKVWKKRTAHAFTAHIQRSGKGDAADGDKSKDAKADNDDDDSSMKFGVDYSDSDMAHESDDGEEECEYSGGGNRGAANDSKDSNGAAKAPASNEALTKKKYCQSTRLFNSIFDAGDRQFDSFYAFVHRVKKYIHNIIYALFVNALPDETGTRLPRELWEKIWKHTQAPYDENDTFNCGNRCTDRKYIELENSRLTDLFGAAGNFHMLIFEILYKHPYITQTPAMLELESLEVRDSRSKKVNSYVKTRFQRYKRLIEMSFSRMIDLQEQPPPQAPPQPEQPEQQPEQQTEQLPLLAPQSEEARMITLLPLS
jgi:hypothetical protein